jgi:hypothetical protein
MKSVIKGSYKANVGAGAETQGFGSTILIVRIWIRNYISDPNTGSNPGGSYYKT